MILTLLFLKDEKEQFLELFPTKDENTLVGYVKNVHKNGIGRKASVQANDILLVHKDNAPLFQLTDLKENETPMLHEMIRDDICHFIPCSHDWFIDYMKELQGYSEKRQMSLHILRGFSPPPKIENPGTIKKRKQQAKRTQEQKDEKNKKKREQQAQLCAKHSDSQAAMDNEEQKERQSQL